MALGMEVGLSPGDFVLHGDPALSSKRGQSPQIFGPCLLRPNGCMDEDVTWYGGRPRPRPRCVRWIKVALGMEVGLGPGHIVLDVDPAPLRKKGPKPPIFGPF